MEKCKYTNPDIIIKRCGTDWTNLDISNLNLLEGRRKDLTEIKLPDDEKFFEKIKKRTLKNVLLPKGDYSKYSFKGTIFINAYFHKEAILPESFFQEINPTLSEIILLPEMDYSKHKFNNSIKKYIFQKNAILPKDFFVQINNNKINRNYYSWWYAKGKLVVLPEGDYSDFEVPTNLQLQSLIFRPNNTILNKNFFKQFISSVGQIFLPNCDFSEFDFSGGYLSGYRFNSESKLPSNSDLFTNLKNKTLARTKLPTMDYSNYSFKGVKVANTDFTRKSKLSSTFFDEVFEYNLSNVIFPEQDFSEFDFKNKIIRYSFFPKNSKLPNNPKLFKMMKGGNVKGTTFPEADYTIYNMLRVNLTDAVFTKNSKVPLTIFNKKRFIPGVKLPIIDCSEVDFEGISLERIVFPDGSKLPNDPNLFQKISRKSIMGTVLPMGDYRKHVFKDVNCNLTKFPKDALLPEYKDFLLDISGRKPSRSGFYQNMNFNSFKLTTNIIANIHNYNLNEIIINLVAYRNQITKTQLGIIRTRYKDKIDKSIYLSKKHTGIDDEENNTEIDSDILTF